MPSCAFRAVTTRAYDRPRRHRVEVPSVPSGILYPGKRCIVGNGVVIDPKVLIGEIHELRARRIDTRGLKISANLT